MSAMFIRPMEKHVEPGDAIDFGSYNFKHYWRVVISRKDNDSPLLEVAGFMDKRIAENYIQNILKTHPEWDDSILTADLLLYALPPWVNEDQLLTKQIRYLLGDLKITEQ